MKTLTPFVLLALLVGCTTPRHQDGGETKAKIPVNEPPAIELSSTQPENPAQQSTTLWIRTTTTTAPDGTVTAVEEKTETVVGPSQDLAKITKEVTGVRQLKGLVMGALLLLGAVYAFAREWPVLGVALAVGASLTLVLPWWVAYVAVGVATLIYLVYGKGAADILKITSLKELVKH